MEPGGILIPFFTILLFIVSERNLPFCACFICAHPRALLYINVLTIFLGFQIFSCNALKLRMNSVRFVIRSVMLEPPDVWCCDECYWKAFCMETFGLTVTVLI